MKPVKCYVCKVALKIGETLHPYNMEYTPGMKRLTCSSPSLPPGECLEHLAKDLYDFYKSEGLNPGKLLDEVTR